MFFVCCAETNVSADNEFAKQTKFASVVEINPQLKERREILCQHQRILDSMEFHIRIEISKIGIAGGKTSSTRRSLWHCVVICEIRNMEQS